MRQQPKPMVHRIPITQARSNLGAIVKRAHLNKEYFILEKDGVPIAGIMDVDEMEDYLELQDPPLKKQIKEGYQEYLRGELTKDLDTFLAELRSESRSKKQQRG
ncbi:MAG: type II toxin-antitoxin system Phd/YefM family antitoxin [Chloroflexi bacterium]|nr:type II toxin-antitoxin system Phd/YefM family antitoxin [Chloroflexota bacterium]